MKVQVDRRRKPYPLVLGYESGADFSDRIPVAYAEWFETCGVGDALTVDTFVRPLRPDPTLGGVAREAIEMVVAEVLA